MVSFFKYKDFKLEGDRFNLVEFNRAMDFIMNYDIIFPRDSINDDYSSYNLKYIASNVILPLLPSTNTYMTTEMLNLAMVCSGYKRMDVEGKSYFNIDIMSCEDVKIKYPQYPKNHSY